MRGIDDGMRGVCQVPAEGTGIDRHVIGENPPDAAARQNPLDGEVAAASDVDVLAAPLTRRRLQHATHISVDASNEHAYIIQVVSRCSALVWSRDLPQKLKCRSHQ